MPRYAPHRTEQPRADQPDPARLRLPLRRALPAASGALALALSVTACSSGASTAQPATESAAPTASTIELPAEYQGRTLSSTVLSNFAPLSFLDDSGTLTGLDYDLAQALGEKLGVEVETEANSFENELLGVESGKHDWTGAAAITTERLEKFDMTSYLTTGDALVVPADAPEIGTELTDLCGMSIGMLTGDRLVSVLEEASPGCDAAGADPIDIQTYPSISDAQLAAQSGNIDAWYTGKIYAAYSMKQAPDTWKVTGPAPRDVVVSGIITRKGSGMAEALAAALNEMIADGTYQEIFDEWGLGDQGVDVAEANPAVASE